jgi:hypothetical protein
MQHALYIANGLIDRRFDFFPAFIVPWLSSNTESHCNRDENSTTERIAADFCTRDDAGLGLLVRQDLEYPRHLLPL